MIRPNSKLLEDIRIEGGDPSERFETTGVVKKRTFLDRVVDSIDKVTKAPRVIRDTADNLNDELVRVARKFKDQTSEVVERNLESGTIDSFFSKVSKWIQKGNNMWLALGGLAVIVYLIRAGK